MGSFVFKWPYPANDVHVTGTFDDWGKSEQLNKVGEHWEKEVQLSSADDKILYKFVVDDQWVVDDNAPKEDDGHYNVNNVLLPENIKRRTRHHRVISTSSAPPGTLSRETSREAPTFSAPTDSAPTLSLEESEANAARWVPHVDPPADYQVTRSLEKTESNIPGAFPDTPANEPETFGVAPIPATGAKDIQSTVTTSKEDYEKAGEGVTSAEPEQTVSVNPIPATGHDNIQSTVTTSQEDYEKGGSLAALGAVGAGAAVIGGAAAATALSKPGDEDKNIIPESSLPMDAQKMDSTDAGPFISSSGPGTTTADLASKVPMEPKREAFVEDSSSAKPFISSSGPGATTADLASKVPMESKRDAVVEDSSEASPFVSSSGPGTTTATLASQVPLEQKRQGMVVDPSEIPSADSEVLKEKSAVERELLGKVPVSEAAGEPEAAAAKQTSYHGLATSVPETVEESMAKANAAPEAASSAAVVAEKSAVEQELLSEVPRVDQAGEPAPTVAAATSTTAPAVTAAGTADAVTDGKTANEVVPDTDTSTASRGVTAGEVAGGAVVGGAAAAGAAAVAAQHRDADVEPPRVADAQKPEITSETAPAAQLSESKIPSTSATGAATEAADKVPGITAPVEKSEGAYIATGDPTLANEPAVKMMAQNEGVVLPSTAATTVDPADAAGAKGAVASTGAATVSKKTEEIPAAKAPETPKKTTAGTSSAASTPAKQTDTAASSPADGKDKKKKNRLSRIWHKIVD